MSNYPQHPPNNMGGPGGYGGGGGGGGGYGGGPGSNMGGGPGGPGPNMGGGPGGPSGPGPNMGGGYSPGPSSPAMMHSGAPQQMQQGRGGNNLNQGGGNNNQWSGGSGGYNGGPSNNGGNYPGSPMGGGGSGPPNYQQGGPGPNGNGGGGGGTSGFGPGGPGGPGGMGNGPGMGPPPGMQGGPSGSSGVNRNNLPSYPPNAGSNSSGNLPSSGSHQQASHGPPTGAPPPPFHPNSMHGGGGNSMQMGGGAHVGPMKNARSPTAMGHSNYPSMNNVGPGVGGPHGMPLSGPPLGGDYGGNAPNRAPPSHNQQPAANPAPGGRLPGMNQQIPGPPGGFAPPPAPGMNGPPSNNMTPQHGAMPPPMQPNHPQGRPDFSNNNHHQGGGNQPPGMNSGGMNPNSPPSQHPSGPHGPPAHNLGTSHFGSHNPGGPVPPPQMNMMPPHQQPHVGPNGTPPGLLHQQPPPHLGPNQHMGLGSSLPAHHIPNSNNNMGSGGLPQQPGPPAMMHPSQLQQGAPTLGNPNQNSTPAQGPGPHQPQVQPRATHNVGGDQQQLPEANPDLFQFLEMKQLVKRAPLSQLRSLIAAGGPAGGAQPSLVNDPVAKNAPVRLAIDGNHVLGQLMKEINAEDPLWLLVGPYPPMLLPKIGELVNNLKKQCSVAPVFVFSGMAVHGDVESFVNTREEMIERDSIWFNVANRTPVQNDQIERAFDIVLGEDCEMMVMRYLQSELGCDVYRAPFLQWGQMVAFTLPQVRFCHALMGPAEVLLMDAVERLIVEIDFTGSGEILYVDKSEVLQKLFSDVNEEVDKASLFLDLALLTATHQALILLRPPLENGTLPYMHPLLRGLANRKERASDYVCSSFNDRRVANSQTWKFLKGRCYVRHCMVLIPDAAKDTLIPLSKLIDNDEKVPRNMTGVLGSRLPLMMYYFQFVGLLSVSTMTTVSQNYIRDDNPVSDSVQYRHCMETVISLRTQVLYQLVQFLQSNPDYYHRVKVSWIRWYEPITAPVRRPPEIRLAHWNLSEVPTQMDLHTVTFQSVIHYSHCGTSSARVKYTTLSQVLHAIFLKSLDLLGYFTHANVDDDFPEGAAPPANAEVSGMSCYSETIKTAVSQPHFVEQCVLLIELLRTKSLALTQFTIVDASNFQNPNFAEIPELSLSEAMVPLATRISSLLYLPTNAQPWPAQHYDRELMTYCVLVRNMHRTLRSTTEVIATSMFLDDSAHIPVSDYAELPKYLPFKNPPNIAAGVLTRYLLESMPANTDDGMTPAQRMAALEKEFPVVQDVPAALKLLFEFWEDAYFVLSELHQKDQMTVDEPLLNVMTSAVTIMRFRRELLFGETPQPSFEGGGGEYYGSTVAAVAPQHQERSPLEVGATAEPQAAGEADETNVVGSASPGNQSGHSSGHSSPAKGPAEVPSEVAADQ